MIGYCNECPDRDMCEDLCEAALAWADQDQFEEDPNIIVYTSPQSLQYLQEEFSLEHKDMINDVELGIVEWRIVKNINLTEMQMQCMWLYYWDGKIQSEIAEKLGISQQVVAEHLEAAEAKLYKELKVKQEVWEKIKKANLTERQFEIAELYYKWDTSQAKIAKRLGISEPTINKHLKIIRKKAKIG